jgi:hypothetical protein
MTNPLFYEKPIALDKEVHKRLRINRSTSDLGFAARTNSVLLAAVEFIPACRDYPIVFARVADGKTVPVALLGIRKDENLFLAEGIWDASTYVPAFVRRYPFVPAETSPDNLTICIDEAFPGFSADEGEPLFDAAGEPAAFLKEAIALIQDYNIECKRTDAFMQRLGELGLFKEMNVRIDMKGGESFNVAGVLMVDEAKLAALDAAAVGKLHAAGDLPLIYAHLFSQANLGRLVDRLAARLLLQKSAARIRQKAAAATSPAN